MPFYQLFSNAGNGKTARTELKYHNIVAARKLQGCFKTEAQGQRKIVGFSTSLLSILRSGARRLGNCRPWVADWFVSPARLDQSVILLVYGNGLHDFPIDALCCVRHKETLAELRHVHSNTSNTMWKYAIKPLIKTSTNLKFFRWVKIKQF